MNPITGTQIVKVNCDGPRMGFDFKSGDVVRLPIPVLNAIGKNSYEDPSDEELKEFEKNNPEQRQEETVRQNKAVEQPKFRKDVRQPEHKK